MNVEEVYGDLVPADGAQVMGDNLLPRVPVTEDDREITSFGNALWSYKFTGRLNGVPVRSEDRRLPIDREDLLNVAFELVSVPQSVMFWMSPDIEGSTDKYDELLKRAADNEIYIAEETAQYEPSKGAYLVWIKYRTQTYALHKRFEYLREESK